jgi:hypothetical protein
MRHSGMRRHETRLREGQVMDVKLVQYRQSWTVEVDLSAKDEIPDMAKQYSSLVYRPDFVSVSFEATGDEAPRLGGVNIHGPRVLKAGLGVRLREHFYGFSMRDYPAWLVAVVEEARVLVDG